MLPGVDGFGIREHSDVGIIVVSARRGELDKVRALNLGADDYLTKPFGIEELLARITATLRRTRQASPESTAQPHTLTFGHVAIDLDAQVGDTPRCAGALDADRVLTAAGVRAQPWQTAHARHAAAARVGTRLRDPDRVRARLCRTAAGQAGSHRRSTAHPHRATRRLPGSTPQAGCPWLIWGAGRPIRSFTTPVLVHRCGTAGNVNPPASPAARAAHR